MYLRVDAEPSAVGPIGSRGFMVGISRVIVNATVAASAAAASSSVSSSSSAKPAVLNADDEDHSKHSVLTEERESHLFAFAIACLTNGRPLNSLPTDARLVCAVALAALMLAGAVCNCALICCMIQFGYSRLGTCLYVAAIASADLVLLLVRCGDLWLRCAFDFSPVSLALTQSKTACSVFPFAYGCVLHLRGFAHLALAWDTASLYWRPVSAWKSLRPDRVGNTLIAFSAAFLVLNSQYLWTYSLQDVRLDGGDVKDSLCTVASTWIAPAWRNTVWPLTDFLVSDVVPLTVVGIAALLSAGCALRHAAKSSTSSRFASGAAREPARCLTTAPDGQLCTEELMEKYIVDCVTFKQLRACFLAVSVMFMIAAVPETVTYVTNFLSFSSVRVSVRLSGRQTLAKAAPDLSLGEDAHRLWLELACRFLAFGGAAFKLVPFVAHCAAARAFVTRCFVRMVRCCRCSCRRLGVGGRRRVDRNLVGANSARRGSVDVALTEG